MKIPEKLEVGKAMREFQEPPIVELYDLQEREDWNLEQPTQFDVPTATYEKEELNVGALLEEYGKCLVGVDEWAGKSWSSREKRMQEIISTINKAIGNKE